MKISDLLQSPSLQSFQQALKDGHALFIEELWDAPKAALLSLAQAIGCKTILVISGQTDKVRLVDDCAYFGIDNTLEFPAWETLPGEEISPSADIVGRRFEILHELLHSKKPCVLFASLQACLQKTIPPSMVAKLCSHFRKGDTFPFESIPSRLQALGYKRVAVVNDKGEYALRGGILDLFPVSAFDPIRIDFFGDEIEDLRYFDPISQKSMGKKRAFSWRPPPNFLY